MEINPYKYLRKKVDKFFDDEISFNEKEVIILVAIFVVFVMLSLGLPLLISKMASQISFIYFIITFSSIMMAVVNESNILFNIACHISVPYIMMFFLSTYILKPFIPYKGNDPMKIRYYKLKRLKKKARINKLKFWK